MGKSSVFGGWECAYYADGNARNLQGVIRRYGFVLVTLSLRDYSDIPTPEANRPESWVLEIIRRRLERFEFVTKDLGLIEAFLKGSQIALALDGTNEVDRDAAISAFANQFPNARMLVTSQVRPRIQAGDVGWEIWELPADLSALRDRLLELWLGYEKGRKLVQRIDSGDMSTIALSGYDIRLLADLAMADPQHAELPKDRATLYRTMLGRAVGLDNKALRLEGLKKLAWTMVNEQRRRISATDTDLLGIDTIRALVSERILRVNAATYEFRHDQMRAFLAASWLAEEIPPGAQQKTIIDAKTFSLSRSNQVELWSFVALLLESASEMENMWNFASEDPAERRLFLAALQVEADKRSVTLVRLPQTQDQAATT